ncbi:hypothetical protein HMPREF9374_0970 [Desmospora sp. 8437]|nr:hypothetical protein HMPREF9374_0970 [Desmospora sp. 8437]
MFGFFVGDVNVGGRQQSPGKTFQFLIGKLQEYGSGKTWGIVGFQFLIGTF